MPRHWYPRLMAACWCGHIPLVTWMAPDSLSGRAVAHSQIAGFFMLLTAIAALIAVADVLVNDILPRRFQLWTINHRHLGYMAMALSMFMLVGVVATRLGPTPVLISYVLAALFTVGVAGLDLRARHERPVA